MSGVYTNIAKMRADQNKETIRPEPAGDSPSKETIPAQTRNKLPENVTLIHKLSYLCMNFANVCLPNIYLANVFIGPDGGCHVYSSIAICFYDGSTSPRSSISSRASGGMCGLDAARLEHC
jgi:hypothetical protein